MEFVGKNIKAARKNAGLSQGQLADAIGTTKSTISKYELDKRQPRFEQLQDIAAALGVDLLFLMGYDTPEKSTDAVIDLISQFEALLSVVLDDPRIPEDVKLFIREDWPADPMASVSALSFHADRVRIAIEEAGMDDPLIRIEALLDALNSAGQEKAVERVEELTEIPKYKKAPPDESEGG